MRRREFITLIGGAALVQPFEARAQQSLATIGFLHEGLPESSSLTAAFRQGLIEGGFGEGRSVAIENRWAEGQYDRLPALAMDLIERRVVVVVAAYLVAARAAKAATRTVPVVFITGSDPVAADLVSSLNRPAGNLTGVAFMFTRLGEKNLATLHELVPSAVVVGALVNPNNPMQSLSRATCKQLRARLVFNSSFSPPAAMARSTVYLPRCENERSKRYLLPLMGSFSVFKKSLFRWRLVMEYPRSIR